MQSQDVLIKALGIMGVDYRVDAQPPQNIRVDCPSETCRYEHGKYHMNIKFGDKGKVLDGTYHCWACHAKGKKFLADIGKLYNGVVSESVIATVQEGVAADVVSSEKLDGSSFENLGDFKLMASYKDVFGSHGDPDYARYFDVLGIARDVDGVWYVAKKISGVGSIVIGVSSRFAMFGHHFIGEALKYRKRDIVYVSDLTEAIEYNVNNFFTSDSCAVYIDPTKDADGVYRVLGEHGLKFRLGEGDVEALAEVKLEASVRDDALKFVKSLFPLEPHTYNSDAQLVEALLRPMVFGVLNTDDLSEYVELLTKMEPLPDVPRSMFVIGDVVNTSMFIGKEDFSVNVFNIDTETEVTKSQCKDGIVVSYSKAMLDRLLLSLEMMSWGDMIVAVGEGCGVLNSVIDEPMIANYNRKERKPLFATCNWLHTVHVKGVMFKVMIVPTTKVVSPFINPSGSENYLTKYTNTVYTDLFLKALRQAYVVYTKFYTRLHKIVDTTILNEFNMLTGVKCYFEVTDELIDRVSDFCRDRVVGVDIEATHLNPYRGAEIGYKLISIAVSDGVESISVWLVDQELTEDLLLGIFMNSGKMVFHNAAFDIRVLMYLYPSIKDVLLECPHKLEDTGGIALAFNLHPENNSNAATRTTSLNKLTKMLFGLYIKDSFAHVDREKMWKYLDSGYVDKYVVLLYNGGDSKWTALAFKLMQMAVGGKNMLNTPEYIHYRRRMEIVVACSVMSNYGIPVSVDGIINKGNALKREAVRIEKFIEEHPLVLAFLESPEGEKCAGGFNTGSSVVRHRFAVEYLGLQDPTKQEVKAHGNSKAGVWKFHCDNNGADDPILTMASEVFGAIVELGQCLSPLRTLILPFRNVLVDIFKDAPHRLAEIEFFDPGYLDEVKLGKVIGSQNDGLDFFSEDDSAYDYENDAYDVIGGKMADFYHITTYDRALGVLRIHTSFKVLGATVSERIASSPNVQNISPEMREIFETPKGQVYCACDCGGADVTIAAALYNDTRLLDMLWNDGDVHREATIMLLECTKGRPDDVEARFRAEHSEVETREEVIHKLRKKIKGNVVFATIYGSHPEQMRATLDLTPESFAEFLPLKAKLLGGIEDGHERMLNQVKTQGYFLDPFSQTKLRGDFSRNQFFNIPVQGGTAKWANSTLLPLIKAGVQLVNIIHDEPFAVEVEEKADSTVRFMAKTLVTSLFKDYPHLDGRMPLKAEGFISNRWDNLKHEVYVVDSSTNYGYTRRKKGKRA